MSQKSEKAGIRYALLCYGSWGLLPLYWKTIQHVSPFEILVHRIFWSWLFYTLLFSAQKKHFTLGLPLPQKLLKAMLIASILIGVNWFVFLYAVNANQIVEASLGYFINPLLNIALGVWLLKEKLNRPKIIALSLAAAGVAVLAYETTGIPWISLSLAGTFAFYGLIKKRANISGIQSGQLESFFMFFPTALLLLWVPSFGSNYDTLFNHSFGTWLLLVGSGPVTGIPLILFTEAARRIPLNVLGMFQYLAPTLQFLTGYLIYAEAVSELKWLGMLFIWVGLAVVSISSLRSHFMKLKIIMQLPG